MNSGNISIIVTCYNQEHCIQATLASVLSQTYVNWECIIIDDGSIDDSAKVIKQCIKEDERFNYIYQTNAGVSKARNAGFALAKGEYINFLDGDDTFLPKKLEAQLAVFEENPEIFVCICDHQHYDVVKDEYAYYQFEPLHKKPLEQFIFKWQAGVAFPQHAALYKRSLWKAQETPFPEDYPHRSEDWVFNILIALKQKPYYFLKEVLCSYHHDKSSYTSEVYNSAASAIHAAFYINPYLPEKYRKDFLDHTIKKSMNRYLESKKVDILHNSGNWRLGNRLTKPFFWVKRKLKF